MMSMEETKTYSSIEAMKQEQAHEEELARIKAADGAHRRRIEALALIGIILVIPLAFVVAILATECGEHPAEVCQEVARDFDGCHEDACRTPEALRIKQEVFNKCLEQAQEKAEAEEGE
jgi:hypothetical protein